MKVDVNDFLQDYYPNLEKLVNETLDSSDFNYLSSYFLYNSFSGDLMNLKKDYIRNKGLKDFPLKDLSIIAKDLDKIMLSIVLHHFHNKSDFKEVSNIKNDYFNTKYFNSIQISGVDIFKGKELDGEFIYQCNEILFKNKLKTKDIYTLRDEILIKLSPLIKKSLPLISQNEEIAFFKKIDSIFKETLRIFEIENKELNQLFPYISIKIDEYSILEKCKFLIEKQYKEKLLVLLLENNLEQAIIDFQEFSIQLIKENSSENVDDLIIETINLFHQRHYKIHNFDEWDL